MNFKEFITESMDGGDEVSIDPVAQNNLNLMLLVELTQPVLTPESGIAKIRKILYLEGIAFESLYDLNTDGEELATHLSGDSFLYILYYPTDDGYYDFYAEIMDESAVEQAMSELEEEDES
jgi:hypothetical protein